MVRRHSKEDATEAQRPSPLNEHVQRKPGEGHESQSSRLPDDEDPHWHRRELEPGWRQPHYEGFYDESAARERAGFPEDARTESRPRSGREHGLDKADAPSGEFWTIPGPESGKGPRGYRRSDERILEEVNERLTRHGQLDATGIEVDCKNGEILLRGTVSDARAKRLAEDCAKSVSGVQNVRNELTLRMGRS